MRSQWLCCACAASSWSVNATQIGSAMQWNNAAEFFAMGGYGVYVWGSFGVTALALVVEVWLIRRRRAAAIDTIHSDGQDASDGR